MRRTILIGCALAAMTAALPGGALAQSAMPPAPPPATVRPGDDFYAYANGAWLAETAMPVGRSTYDSTAMLRDLNAGRVRELIDEAVRAPASDRARRVGDYYAAWMDTDAIEARGLAPLAGDLAGIAAIGDRTQLSAWLGGALRLDDGTNTRTDGVFGVWIHQGFRDGTRHVPHLMQGGLGLASPGDYADAAEGKVIQRGLYRGYVADLLALAGLDDVQARADRVLALETAIAATHAPREHTDDVFRTDNPWTRAELEARAPGMDWAAWLAAAGLDRQETFNVWQPSAVTGTAALAGSQPVEAWRDYLTFHQIRRHVAVLPEAFRRRQAEYDNGLRSTLPALPDRAPQALDATTAALGQDLSQLYVQRYFPPESKAAAEAMVANIRTAFAARLAALDWMTPATREMALAKLATLQVGVGYPDAWTDYGGLEVRRDDAYGNLRRAERAARDRELAKLDRPVDPAEWSAVLPHRVGAILNFSPNSMQFSAGILQTPYFDPTGDAASNYGSAGAGLSHEVSHTFDELGAIYDAEGRLLRWWTPQDRAGYQAASAPMLAQLNAYCPAPDLCVNGEQVLSETTADLAGLSVAYDAYILSLNGRPDVVKEGLTGDQRFFLAFARRWRRLQGDEALRRQFATDNHAPGATRAWTVRNHDAWYRAFDIQPGDALYLAPEHRVRVW